MKLCITLLLMLPVTCFAVSPNTPRAISETFLTAVARGDISNGYDALFSGSHIVKDNPQAVALLKQQTRDGLPFYGKVLGYSFIKEDQYGDSIVRLVYVLKLEKAPTIWEFYFYRPNNAWFLANVLFNDQFALLR